MAYEPTIWECGDVVTAERLNKLEEAVAALSDCCESGGDNSPLIVNVADSVEMTLDKTWNEIHDAFPNVVLRMSRTSGTADYAVLSVMQYLSPLDPNTTIYQVGMFNGSSAIIYETDSADGYPEKEILSEQNDQD